MIKKFFNLDNSSSFQNSSLIAGEWVKGNGESFPVLDKYALKPFAQLHSTDLDQIHQTIEYAANEFAGVSLTNFERGQILDRAANLIEKSIDQFSEIMVIESGFPKNDAANELRRGIQTLRVSADEARRFCGEMVPIEGAPQQSGRIAFTIRVPLGLVAAITPFNAPFNTVAHKIAPAIGAGNAVILKPSSSTPFTACLIAHAFVEAGLPKGFISVVHGSASTVDALLADQRIKFFAFTGSTEVGIKIQQGAGLRRTQMELGSIAFTILNEDTNLESALPKVIGASYRKAGQVCTSIQILLVHQNRIQEVQQKLTQMVGELAYGDPNSPQTVVGPVISLESAKRIESWIHEAVSAGATILAGGTRSGAVVAPTLLTNVHESMRVGCAEVFGPVLSIVPFHSISQAIAKVNSTPFGLATGIFTSKLDDALFAAKKLVVGGVHINETSSSRVDLMPYGGSKNSGFGREGPKYAMHEMSEERIITMKPQ
jgi:acyl-CoA reductase-like NAD-dependent aldehyde dehydrogenase